MRKFSNTYQNIIEVLLFSIFMCLTTCCFAQNTSSSTLRNPTEIDTTEWIITANFRIDSVCRLGNAYVYEVSCVDTGNLHWGTKSVFGSDYYGIQLTIISFEHNSPEFKRLVSNGEVLNLTVYPPDHAWIMYPHEALYGSCSVPSFYQVVIDESDPSGYSVYVPITLIRNQVMLSRNIKGKYYIVEH